jgi:hypothetical protein
MFPHISKCLLRESRTAPRENYCSKEYNLGRRKIA